MLWCHGEQLSLRNRSAVNIFWPLQAPCRGALSAELPRLTSFVAVTTWPRLPAISRDTERFITEVRHSDGFEAAYLLVAIFPCGFRVTVTRHEMKKPSASWCQGYRLLLVATGSTRPTGPGGGCCCGWAAWNGATIASWCCCRLVPLALGGCLRRRGRGGRSPGALFSRCEALLSD